MEEKKINETLAVIQSKYNQTLLLSFLPIKMLFSLIKYSKQYQSMIKLSLDDYKFVYNYLNQLNNKTVKNSNESLQELNIKLRLRLEHDSVNYNTIHQKILFHTEHKISSVLILKDNRIALGTVNGYLLLSTLNIKKNLIEIIDAHKDKITSLIQLENSIVVSSSIDKDIKMWNLKKFEMIYVFKLGKPVHSLVEFSSEIIIAGTNELIAFNTINLGVFHTVKEHYGTVYSLVKANQTDLIVGSSKLKIIRFCSNKAILYSNYMDYISIFEGNAFAIRAVLSLNNSQIASAEDSIITIWDIHNNKYLWKLQGHKKSIYTLELINDDAFVSGGEDYMIIIWNINDFCKSKLIYTCFESRIIKIIKTKKQELLVFSNEGKMISFKEDKSNDEDDGVIYDFYTEDRKMKKMIKLNQSKQLNFISHEEQNDEIIFGYAP